jgi:predicted ATP-dependent endonuclease of OLD family
MITKLDVRSFKAFERFTVHFRGDAYMVGPNNAGKSTLISALRTAAHMLRYAMSRSPTIVRRDGDRGQFLAYPLGPDQYGLVTENLRHEFHPVETRLEVVFSNKGILRAVWPADDQVEDEEWSPEETGFFYLIGGTGRQPRKPGEVRQTFPRVGVIPILSPIEHDERPLNREYVVENFDGRLTSRHFRNQLRLLQGELDQETGKSLFQLFKEFATEWAPEIEIRSLETGEQINLYYREVGRRSEKEVFWGGDGFQVWLQLLLHLFRLRDVPSIVLDEPDVFLHADLQRRLVRLIESFECQTITATHSAEMLTEAPSQAVVWVDKTRTRAVRAPTDALLSELSDALGSQFNLRLARALRIRAVLFVEGDDMKILRIVADTVGAPKVARELGIVLVPLHGFSNWEHVEPFAWLVDGFLEKSVSTLVLLDRDYRSDAAVKQVRERLRSAGVTAHVWKRKELESYFLNPRALARLSGAAEEWIHDTLLDAAESLKDGVYARMLDAYLVDRRGSTKHRVTLTEEFTRLFASKWGDEQWRLEYSPPKELLKALNRALEADGKRSVTLRSLARSLRMSEIPDEMVSLIREVEEAI